MNAAIDLDITSPFRHKHGFSLLASPLVSRRRSSSVTAGTTPLSRGPKNAWESSCATAAATAAAAVTSPAPSKGKTKPYTTPRRTSWTSHQTPQRWSPAAHSDPRPGKMKALSLSPDISEEVSTAASSTQSTLSEFPEVKSPRSALPTLLVSSPSPSRKVQRRRSSADIDREVELLLYGDAQRAMQGSPSETTDVLYGISSKMNPCNLGEPTPDMDRVNKRLDSLCKPNLEELKECEEDLVESTSRHLKNITELEALMTCEVPAAFEKSASRICKKLHRLQELKNYLGKGRPDGSSCAKEGLQI
mmetsp:Transcript_10324/g.18825  ORF Transcript_10324/g.18825 Transcript_10324/m.18825 type:complete len:304 (+) Transcript_10324:2-913(+)